MSEEEKRQRLLSLGFDPSLYTYESDLAEQPSEISQTPTKSVVSAKPSLVEDITANLAGGLGPSIRNIPRAGRTLLDVARGITPEAADVSNLANVGIGAVLPPAQELAISGLKGEPLPSLSDLAIASAS